MSPLARAVSDPHFSTEDSELYFRTGSILARKLIDPEGIDLLQQANNEDFRPADHSQKFAPEFDRYSNQFLSRTDRLKRLVEDLHAPLSELVQRDVVFTQGIIFSLNPGTRGYRWHFDNLSFCFIRPEDLAFTLWIPLTPIRVNEQNGGMLLVDRSEFCGRVRMLQWAYYERRGGDSNPQLAAARHSQYGKARWYGDFDLEMLDDLGHERDMDVGDALIFDRYTWHRSQELKPGPIEARTAVALRVVDADARFDKPFFELSMKHRADDDVPPLFGHLLSGLDDGIRMREALASGVSLWG